VRVFVAATVVVFGALLLVSNASTSFPGDVGVIAFDRPGDANVDIYTMEGDGSNLRNISNNPAGDRDPRYSPDGKRIVFVSNRDGNWEIYVMNADGSAQTRLTDNSAIDELPAWTADGRIVFGSYRDGNDNLYVMAADGGSLRRLTNDPGTEAFPAPAPTGDRIAFISDRDGTFDVYTMSIDGDGSWTRVTDSPVSDVWPIWSPAGTKIAFDRWNGDNHVIETVNADGTGLTRITNVPGREEVAPAWSPDGTRLAFLGCYSNNCDLVVRNADGSGAETTLVHGGAGAPDWQALPRNTSTSGSGGASIATAPELSLGQQHTASRFGGPDYWRIALGAGDELTIRFGATGGGAVRLCLLAPMVADESSDNAICEASSLVQDGGTGELHAVAPFPGRWTLAVDACASCAGVFHPHDRPDVGYALTALVRRYTHVTAHAPHTVRAGASFTCTGRVTGASAGRIDLDRRSATGWARVTAGPIRSDGRFTLRTRLAGASRRTAIRLSYAGDAGHLPSATTLVIGVR